MKVKKIKYKTKSGKIQNGVYVNEDYRGYFILPDGKTRKKHIKFSQVITIKEET
jgi:hypothetical protein